MEVCSQLHTPTALTTGKLPLVLTVYCPYQELNHEFCCIAGTLVAILAELSQLPKNLHISLLTKHTDAIHTVTC
jgi:hypothetical protein